MAGGGFVDENDPAYKHELRGWRFHFNSYTLRGRFNFAVVTYGGLATILAYKFLFKKKKKPAVENKESLAAH